MGRVKEIEIHLSSISTAMLRREAKNRLTRISKLHIQGHAKFEDKWRHEMAEKIIAHPYPHIKGAPASLISSGFVLFTGQQLTQIEQWIAGDVNDENEWVAHAVGRP